MTTVLCNAGPLIALGKLNRLEAAGGALWTGADYPPDHGVARNYPEAGSPMILRTPNCAPSAWSHHMKPGNTPSKSGESADPCIRLDSRVMPASRGVGRGLTG